MPVYNLADIPVNINMPDWLLMPNFGDFITTAQAGLVHFDILFDDIPSINKLKLLVNSRQQLFYETSSGTAVQFDNEQDILALITADPAWQNCSFFFKKNFDDVNSPGFVQLIKDRLLSSVIETFTAVLASNKGIHIHSAAIDWQGNGLVFAAPSGIGKSTHAHLWKSIYDVSILDGDVSACRIIDGRPYVFGLPWCGSSEEYMNSSAPLKAVVFLEQAEENRISKLEKSEAVIRLISGSFLPYWSEYLMGKVIDIAHELSDKVDCYLLQCRPDYESVEMVKRCIEG